jgi:hypothetical protein
VLLEALRAWIDREGLRAELADGESATLDEGGRLAGRGLIDVVQADILAASFSRWRRAGGRLTLASTPGFGIELDEETYRSAVDTGGFDIKAGGGDS